MKDHFKINQLQDYEGTQCFSLPIKLKTSFINSLKPSREQDVIILSDIKVISDLFAAFSIIVFSTEGYLDLSSSTWMCPFLCHPSEQPHTHQNPSWKSDRENDEVVKQH